MALVQQVILILGDAEKVEYDEPKDSCGLF